jgi:hypothetical protein
MQLVPSLADSVYLYGKIKSQATFTAGGLAFDNCVECMYAVDMGVQVMTDEEGTIIGKFRTWDYGVVIYAPTIGPIYSHERRLEGFADLQDPTWRLRDNTAVFAGVKLRDGT